MISVNRGTFVPTSLDGDSSVGAKELDEARKHYKAGTKKKFTFKAYKRPDVKRALETLFSEKCAYCETKYGASQPIDVEHFRPKGGVEDEGSHPGYWWVAMRWSNLLPSCIDCNRRRAHIVVTEEMTLADIERSRATGAVDAGKGMAFPIRGKRCLPEDNDFGGEDALLIDPTTRDPRNHIAFLVDTRLSVVTPREVNGTIDPYGATSIGVYGLNRLRLVQARTRHLHWLLLTRDRVFRYLDNAAKEVAPDSKEKWNREALATWNELRDAARYDEPYSAVAAALVESIASELRGELENLSEEQSDRHDLSPRGRRGQGSEFAKRCARRRINRTRVDGSPAKSSEGARRIRSSRAHEPRRSERWASPTPRWSLRVKVARSHQPSSSAGHCPSPSLGPIRLL